MSKFIAHATSTSGHKFAILKRGKGFSVVQQASTGYCWKYVDGGKAPMALEMAKEMMAACSL